MPYATTMDTPATEEHYRRVREKLGDETPPGLVMHLAIKSDSGIRHIDVWDTEADWDRFQSERLTPAVRETLAEFGIPAVAPPEREALQVVDVWLP